MVVVEDALVMTMSDCSSVRPGTLSARLIVSSLSQRLDTVPDSMMTPPETVTDGLGAP